MQASLSCTRISLFNTVVLLCAGYEISSFSHDHFNRKSLYHTCYCLSYIHCVVFSCGTTDLAPPVNGQLTVFGSVASYACDSGYTLVGDAMRTCLLSGWNGTNPVCGK